jgi:hypothetical protein
VVSRLNVRPVNSGVRHATHHGAVGLKASKPKPGTQLEW